MKIELYGVILLKNENVPECISDILLFENESLRENYCKIYEDSEYYYCQKFNKNIEIK